MSSLTALLPSQSIDIKWKLFSPTVTGHPFRIPNPPISSSRGGLSSEGNHTVIRLPFLFFTEIPPIRRDDRIFSGVKGWYCHSYPNGFFLPFTGTNGKSGGKYLRVFKSFLTSISQEWKIFHSIRCVSCDISADLRVNLSDD